MDRWNPIGCCHREGRKPSEVWIGALGLPLHLWNSTIFRGIGQRCGGFVAVDDTTEQRRDLRWARILVRFKEEMPASVRIGIGSRIFAVPIWVESTTFSRQWLLHGGFGCEDSWTGLDSEVNGVKENCTDSNGTSNSLHKVSPLSTSKENETFVEVSPIPNYGQSTSLAEEGPCERLEEMESRRGDELSASIPKVGRTLSKGNLALCVRVEENEEYLSEPIACTPLSVMRPENVSEGDIFSDYVT